TLGEWNGDQNRTAIVHLGASKNVVGVFPGQDLRAVGGDLVQRNFRPQHRPGSWNPQAGFHSAPIESYGKAALQRGFVHAKFVESSSEAVPFKSMAHGGRGRQREGFGPSIFSGVL